MIKTGKDFIIYGDYADKILELVKRYDLLEIEDGPKLALFDRNLDVFLIAPIIGLREEKFVDESELHRKSQSKLTINYSQLSQEEEKINYTSKLIYLYSKRINLPYKERLDKVFRKIDKHTKEVMKNLYLGYLRGGIDILYDSLLENSDDITDAYLKLYDLIADFSLKDTYTEDFESVGLLDREILELGKY